MTVAMFLPLVLVMLVASLAPALIEEFGMLSTRSKARPLTQQQRDALAALVRAKENTDNDFHSAEAMGVPGAALAALWRRGYVVRDIGTPTTYRITISGLALHSRLAEEGGEA